MKLLISVIALSLLFGCASTHKILVKNCKPLGSGLFECEEIPKKEIGKR